MKPAYPNGTATLPGPDPSLKPPPRPVEPASGAAKQVNSPNRINGSRLKPQILDQQSPGFMFLFSSQGSSHQKPAKRRTGAAHCLSRAEVTATPPPCLACPASAATAPSVRTRLGLCGCDSCGTVSESLCVPLVGGKTPTDPKSLAGTDVPPPVPSRTNHNADNLLRDNQVGLVSPRRKEKKVFSSETL